MDPNLVPDSSVLQSFCKVILSTNPDDGITHGHMIMFIYLAALDDRLFRQFLARLFIAWIYMPLYCEICDYKVIIPVVNIIITALFHLQDYAPIDFIFILPFMGSHYMHYGETFI